MFSILIVLLLTILAVSPVSADPFTRIIDGRELAFEEIYFEDFSESFDNWLSEGNALVELDRGRMRIDARGGMTTVWCKKEFSGPQLVEYDVRLMSESLESNINMILLAGNPDAGGLIAGTKERDGTYSQYHTFPNYLITVLNAVSKDKREQLRIRMRYNPGFELIGECWDEPLIFGKVYHIAYLIDPPELTIIINGKAICRTLYENSLLSGLHGFRIWQTHSLYDNFRVSRLLENNE